MKRFTPEERAVLDKATPRQIMILRKLARLIGPTTERLDQSVPISALVGKGYDDFDMRRVGLLLKNLKAMFDNFLMEDGFYRMRLNPVSLSWIRKQAENRPANNGRGTLYGDATLALKMRMGIHTDVWLKHPHGHENFNCGEDTSYLDQAFFGFWRMSFAECPHKFVRQNIEVRPIRHERLEICQDIRCNPTGRFTSNSYELGVIPTADFLDPEKWDKTSSEMAEKAEDNLRRKIEFLEEEGK